MDRPLHFQNTTRNQMEFDQVFHYIHNFMKQMPMANYKLMLGTDSQVHMHTTVFITGIVIQRIGAGVWACFRKEIVPRQMHVLGERISYETSLTEEIANLFSEEKKSKLIDVVLPHIYKGASFTIEGHIDIGAGERNRTRVYVKEMMARIESLGMEAKIKPDAIVASGYANKYTK